MNKEEAIKILRELHDKVLFSERTALETLHPELKESEDEKMMHQLYSWMKEFGGAEEYTEKVHTWLKSLIEKQGTYYTKRDVDDAYVEGMVFAKEELGKQGEQKPAEKVEPKFKVGDKIIKFSKTPCPVHSSTDDTICKVAEVHDTCYILNTKEGRIQVPFEWQDHYELVGQKPAWSEEDEVKINRIVACLENLNVADNDILLKDVDWLKSLKERYFWKPETWEILILESVIEKGENPKNYSATLHSILEQLKKLKGE